MKETTHRAWAPRKRLFNAYIDRVVGARSMYPRESAYRRAIPDESRYTFDVGVQCIRWMFVSGGYVGMCMLLPREALLVCFSISGRPVRTLGLAPSSYIGRWYLSDVGVAWIYWALFLLAYGEFKWIHWVFFWIVFVGSMWIHWAFGAFLGARYDVVVL